MKSYTRPDGCVVVPSERRRVWLVLDSARILGSVSMHRDSYGLYVGVSDGAGDFRSASLAHALDVVAKDAA